MSLYRSLNVTTVADRLTTGPRRVLLRGRARRLALALSIALAVLPGALLAQSNIVADAQPGVSGVEKVGQTLTADRGSMGNHITAVRGDETLPNNGRGVATWNNPGGIRWQRLDGGTWTDISGSNHLSYTLQTADLGKQIRFRLWAHPAGRHPRYDYVSVAYPVGSTVRASTVPSLTAMAVSSPAGSFTTGDAIEFTVTFSGAVDVTGSPRMDIVIGNKIRQATYQSGSGTAALVFSYTVQEQDRGQGDSIRVGISQAVSTSTNNKMTTIDLRGGTINASGASDAAILTNNYPISGAGRSSHHRVESDGSQPTTGLISNWAKSNNANTVTLAISGTTTAIAQSFRTDSTPGIFRGVTIQGILTASTTVAIYSDASGQPGTSLRSLTVQNSSRLNGTILRYQSFGTSDPLSLAANTTYWVVVEGAGTLATTSDTGEDTSISRMKGWRIGDRAYVKTSGTWAAIHRGPQNCQYLRRGYPRRVVIGRGGGPADGVGRRPALSAAGIRSDGGLALGAGARRWR